MAIISIYESIGRNLSDVLVKGVPTNATATGMESNVLIHPQSDQLKGKDIYFYSGDGAGQARTITAFTPGSNSIGIDQPFSTVPSANSKFLIFNRFTADDYENAMNRAIGWCQLKHLDDKVATLQIIATQYEYVVPSGFEYIHTLRLVPTGSSDYDSDDYVSRQFEFPPRFWRIESNPLGSFIISFDRRKLALDDFDEDWLRIMGQAKPDFTGTQIPAELQEYVINGASMLMASQRINENREWQAKFHMFREVQKDLEEYIFKHPRGKQVG